MTIIPRPQPQPQRPYQDQLPEGATIIGWNEGFVVWKEACCAFPDAFHVVHPVKNGRIAGSGIYDLTAAEATELTGIPL